MHGTTASDAHGRNLSTSPDAAEWYREAQRVAHHPDEPSVALHRAVEADPDFALAVADLNALSGSDHADSQSPRLTTWERHHREIVMAAAHGQVARAVSLLREHLTEVGCDPLALRIVGDAVTERETLEDIRISQPACHAG